jgi:adenosylmethionine-8-amino-7-oxononanoate aminotransferase
MARVLAPLRENPHVADVRQLGTIAGVELCADRQSGVAYPAKERHGYRVCKQTTAHGVWLRPLGDVVVVMPPLSINDAELALLGRVLRESIDAVCQ